MGHNKKYRARGTPKRSRVAIAQKPLRMGGRPKRLETGLSSQDISPKPSPPIFNAKVLETFTLTDFVDMAAAGRPYPGEPSISHAKMHCPLTIPAEQARQAGAEASVNANARDAAVDRVLEYRL